MHVTDTMVTETQCHGNTLYDLSPQAHTVLTE